MVYADFKLTIYPVTNSCDGKICDEASNEMEGAVSLRKKAVVIGGGLGGLAAALTLSRRFDVTIIEKNNHLGGKMQSIDMDGYHFDYGPNTLTMPQYFWRVIAPFGEARKLLPFEKIDCPSHHMRENKSVVFSTDVQYMKEQIGEICLLCASNYEPFIEEITRLYHLSEKYFLNETFFSTKDYMNVKLVKSLASMHPTKTLESFIKSYFPNDYVSQLFLRFATYIGSSPYDTPATFALIAYFELVEGTYYLKGGATQIAKVFEALLKEKKVRIRLNETVLAVHKNEHKITACTTNVSDYDADIVICNTDYFMFQTLLGRSAKRIELSTSAYIELISLTEPTPLYHHNVLFSDDYKSEFNALRNGRYASNPTVYACYPYASDHTHPPALFVLINAPAYAKEQSEVLAQQVTDALNVWGVREEQIKSRKALPPSYIASTFLVKGGAIYGQASNSMSASFLRPKNKDQQFDNLYYVGGTVHPGGGSPIVVNNGYQVAKRILREL